DEESAFIEIGWKNDAWQIPQAHLPAGKKTVHAGNDQEVLLALQYAKWILHRMLVGVLLQSQFEVRGQGGDVLVIAVEARIVRGDQVVDQDHHDGHRGERSRSVTNRFHSPRAVFT